MVYTLRGPRSDVMMSAQLLISHRLQTCKAKFTVIYMYPPTKLCTVERGNSTCARTLEITIRVFFLFAVSSRSPLHSPQAMLGTIPPLLSPERATPRHQVQQFCRQHHQKSCAVVNLLSGAISGVSGTGLCELHTLNAE